MKRITILLTFILGIILFSSGTSHAVINVKSGQIIELEWNANTESDLKEYELQISTSVNGPWTEFIKVTNNGHIIEGGILPEGDSVFSLIAIDTSGNRSLRSEPSEIIRNDNTAPSAPGTITITIITE